MTPRPPRRFMGPPDWLHPLWGVDTDQDYQTPAEDPTMGRPINTHATTDPQGIRARETLQNIRAVNACRFRTNPETGCLAGCATCIRPDRPGRVTRKECFKCMGFSV